jgi:hypothetical protein
MDGKRMHAALKFIRQRAVDHAMPFEAALSGKGGRYNIKTEMGFAAGPVAGMSLVQTGFVFDVQALRRESRDKPGCYDVLHSHFEDSIVRHDKMLLPARRADFASVKS